MEKEFLRPDEVMEWLSIKKSTFYRMINDPIDPLPAYRVNKKGHLKIRKIDVEKRLERYKVKPEE